jgi:diaminohydroxyphosphoribosylaminopyrimidine deaminase/5-amino-6-(5-phosphoribosylamino)uracil reductase
VIVRGGRVVARGYHHRAGLPHAEIEALHALPRQSLARGATLYVTLEPCSTHGRTPPCTSAIIEAGFARVVVGTVDPNPRHAGRGLELLRAHGIEVRAGVLERECHELNAPFNKWIVTGLPWVIAKAGLSLDGRLTRPPGESRWLTGEQARADAHRLRARVDAILIGANTLRADDPSLTVRGAAANPDRPQPWRVVVSGGRNPLPRKAKLFTDEHRERTLVFRRRSLRGILRELGRRHGVTSVLIEGGMRVLGEAFDRHLVDEVCFYLAPILCGGPIVAVGGRGVATSAEAPPLHQVSYEKVGEDLVLRGRVGEAAE